MSIKVSCPSCNAGFNAPEKYAGRQAKCPKCGGPIKIPKVSLDQPATAVPKAEHIKVACPSCSAGFNADQKYAGKQAKCPKCGGQISIPARAEKRALPTEPNIAVTKTGNIKVAATPVVASSVVLPSADGISHDVGGFQSIQTSKTKKSKTGKVPHSATSRESAQSYQVVMWICAIGLLMLALSPLFRWINILGGGITGLAGDGKIVLAVTVFCILLYGAASYTGKQLVAIFLGVGAWGTVMVVWMGYLITQISSTFKSDEVDGNPFVVMFATQVTPGSGLYLGLVGGLVTAITCGYLATQYPGGKSRLWQVCTIQTAAVAVGILMAIVMTPGPSSSSSASTSSNTSGLASLFNSSNDTPNAGEPGPRNAVKNESNDESVENAEPSEAELVARKAYAKHVLLRDIEVGESILGEDGVYGELKNTGDRTLSEVEITVYSLDSEGQPIADATHYPVRKSESTWSSEKSIPLRPNYAEKFGYKIKSGTDWSGKVRVEVTDLEFADETTQEQPALADPVKNAYLASLEIRNLRKGESVLDEAGVFGEVKNTGQRVLNEIAIIIYCLDDAGQRVYEKHYYPVLVSDGSFSLDPDKPLKPNYTEEFGCKMDDAPSDWSGDVEVVVYDLEFAK